MSDWPRVLRSERGVALPLALILLLVLAILATTFLSLAAVERQISRNLSDGARARQLAESGLEWALTTQLAGKHFDDPTLLGSGTTTGGACPFGTTCKVLASNQALPGLASTQGTFTVTLRNDRDVVSGDQALIGAGKTPDTSWTADVNGVVILNATGRFGAGTNPAVRTITAVIQRGNLNINAALSLPGVQSDTFTNAPPCAGCYSIDGRDWKITDAASPTGMAAIRRGIATYTGNQGALTREQVAEAGFDTAAKRGYVQGLDVPDGSPDAAGTGRRTIAADTSLSPASIQDFLTNLAANPQTQFINSTQACQYPASGGAHSKPEGLRMAATGTPNQVTVRNNCTGASQVNQTISLGSATSPAMVYVRGQYDPSSNFIGMGVDGASPITGYGVLVMEDADLSFFQSGQFTWHGIVLVTGRNVGVGFRSGSNTEIRGALIGNETNASEAGGYFEYLNQADTLKVRYGKAGIDLALLGLYNLRVAAYREN